MRAIVTLLEYVLLSLLLPLFSSYINNYLRSRLQAFFAVSNQLLVAGQRKWNQCVHLYAAGVLILLMCRLGRGCEDLIWGNDFSYANKKLKWLFDMYKCMFIFYSVWNKSYLKLDCGFLHFRGTGQLDEERTQSHRNKYPKEDWLERSASQKRVGPLRADHYQTGFYTRWFLSVLICCWRK